MFSYEKHLTASVILQFKITSAKRNASIFYYKVEYIVTDKHWLLLVESRCDTEWSCLDQRLVFTWTQVAPPPADTHLGPHPLSSHSAFVIHYLLLTGVSSSLQQEGEEKCFTSSEQTILKIFVSLWAPFCDPGDAPVVLLTLRLGAEHVLAERQRHEPNGGARAGGG